VAHETGSMRRGLATILILGLAGCGGTAGSTQTGVSGASSAGSRSGTAGPVSSSSPSTTTTTTTLTTSASQPECVASTLTASFLGQQGATGHGELGFVLRNTGSRPCRSFGYPGIEFLDGAGKALPTDSTRTTHDFFGSTHLAVVVIEPGANASFRVGVTHGLTSTKHCTTAAAMQVIAPNDTATMRVSIPEGAFECGTATVSPLQAGNAAYP
jgi:hypothetical protein